MRLSEGRILDRNGYVRLRVASGDWRYEHRHIWELTHGAIPEGHHVHHRNEIRHDNRPENLMLQLGVDHNREHTAHRHATGELNNRGDNSVRWRRELNTDDIVRRRKAGESFRSIGRSLGANHNVISLHYRRGLEGVG